MKAFRICGCLWLMGALLSVVAGGGAHTYVKKGPEKATNTVTLNNCKADPDTVRVAKGSTLTWINDPLESPAHTYTVKFRSEKPSRRTRAHRTGPDVGKLRLQCPRLDQFEPIACTYDLIRTAARSAGSACVGGDISSLAAAPEARVVFKSNPASRMTLRE
jgi:plastocyanin